MAATSGGAALASTLDDARAFHRAGEYDRALAAYREVTLTSSVAEDVATAHNNACVVLMNQGDYRNAKAQCDEARRLRVASGDEVRLARTLNNLGTVLETLGDYGEAESAYRDALRINQANEDLQAQTVNLSNLGVLAMSLGQFAAALAHFDAAQSIAENHRDQWWSEEQRVLAIINRGVVLERLGSYREALEQYVEVLETGGDSLDPMRKMTLQQNIGVAYRNLGDPIRALAAFRASVDSAGDDTGALANAWLNIGIVQHLNLADPAAAEAAYRIALALMRSSGDHAGEIQGLAHIGRLLLDEGRYNEAQRSFAQALDEAQSSGNAEGRWAALDGLARVHAARGNYPAALERVNEAIAGFEAVRADLGQRTLRQNYLGEKRAVYSLAVAIRWALEQQEPGVGHAAEAFRVTQQAKARELLEAMGNTASLATPMAAKEIRAGLANRLVLEYYVAEHRLFLWTLDSQGLQMFDLGDHADIQSTIRTTHGRLANGRGPDAGVIETLSTKLLGPAAGELDRHRELRIAPDGRLHYLPFELLHRPDAAGLLGESHVVSYLPSASAGQWLRPALPHRLSLSGFADARLDIAGAGYQRDALIQRFALEPLPSAREELRKLDAVMPGAHEIRFGEQATEQAFRDTVTQGADIVHVAGHTVVDERYGLHPAIVLSPDIQHDGLLYPGEISALDYRATLTVLAACRTALGSASDGRAIASLTGSILAAGSSAVVATLWDVDDRAAAVFMEQFYARLARGLAPAQALQSTKREFLNDTRWNNAADWAGFVLIGDAPPLVTKRLRMDWLLASGFMLALLFLIRIRARHSQ